MQPRSFSLLSASKVLAAVRRGLLWVFLPLAALLALPSLLAALLLWWRAGKTWDAQERWSGIRLLAVVCGGVYARSSSKGCARCRDACASNPAASFPGRGRPA